MLAITVAVARQPLTCLACETKTFCTLELSSDNKTFYYLHYNFETLKCRYMKTNCLISFKLAAFNNDTLSCLNTNFQKDGLSFKVSINFIIWTK